MVEERIKTDNENESCINCRHFFYFGEYCTEEDYATAKITVPSETTCIAFWERDTDNES